MRIRSSLAGFTGLTVATLALLAPAAQAGFYTVHACDSFGRAWGNASWAGDAAAGIAADENCTTGSATIGNSVAAGTNPIAAGATGTITFTAPTGTTINDFALTRGITYRNPIASGTHKLYASYKLGFTVFAGAGNYQDATRDRLNAQGLWYGYPQADVTVAKSAVTKSSFPELAGYRGDARTLQLAVGCFNRSSPCSVAAGGNVSNVLYGARVIINDPVAPTVAVEASGLLAGSQRNGSDPVTVTASDNAGIKRVEIIDVTGTPVIVGGESYDGGLTDKQTGCSFRQERPCPNLTDETVVSSSLEAGRRTLKVRVIDSAENIVEQGPYSVDVITPSNRGAFNGSDATDDAGLTARFTRGAKTRRTVGYNDRVRITGRLLNSAGRPIAGARVNLFTRNMSQGARFVERGSAVTGADGVYVAAVSAGASRLIQVGWRSHVNDGRFQETAYVTLKARASARLSASPRRVGLGRTVILSGRVRGTLPRRGVALIFQGRGNGESYSTFADGRASRSGRFRVRYRFRAGGSRGRTFVFHVKLRRDAGFPYEQGYSNRVRVRVL